MKTYKTYQEAKIANPNCEAFTAVTKPFFELQKELEAGELYVKYGSDGMFVRTGSISIVSLAYENGDLYYKPKPKPADWRDEAVRESVVCYRSTYGNLLFIGDIALGQEMAEKLAKAILAGIEKAK